MSVQQVQHHVMQMLHVKTKLVVTNVFAIKVFLMLCRYIELEKLHNFSIKFTKKGLLGPNVVLITYQI